MFRKIIFLSMSMFILNGCIPQEPSPLADVRVHMIESQKLSLLVREIDLVVYERLKSELERDNMRRRYALRLAEVLKDLSYRIENVSDNELVTIVNKKDIKVYREYASKLYINSEEIHSVAQNYEFEKLPSKLDEMEANCNACHSHFRKY